MSQPTRPRRLFRARRRGDVLHIGRAPLPAVAAWVAAHRSRLQPGTVTEVEVWHDADCPYPRGGPCSCANGPEIHLSGETPEEN
jgi:hypothetical protein